MRTLLVAIIIMISPLFVNAQNFKAPKIQMPQQMLDPYGNMRTSPPVTPQTPTIKPLYRNHVENAEARVVREEQKLIKMWRKAKGTEADLKTNQEQLTNLENGTQISNNQKSINKTKKQIAKL